MAEAKFTTGFMFDPKTEPATHLIQINVGSYVRILTIGKEGEGEKGTLYHPNKSVETRGGKQRTVWDCPCVWVPERMSDRLTMSSGPRETARLLAIRSDEDALADPFPPTKRAKDMKPPKKRRPVHATAADALAEADSGSVPVEGPARRKTG